MMARFVLKACSLVLGAILGGPAGCGSVSGDHPVNEYATPYATFKLSGTTVAVATHNPVPGIVVSLQNTLFQAAQTTSDSNGVWSLTGTTFPGDATLVATDPDGTSNGGSFATKSITVTANHTTTGSGWDQGTYEKAGVEIDLDLAE